MSWEYVPPVYDVACTLCVRRIRHDHPDGLRPVWPCLFCHDGYHIRCDVYQFCSCDCGLKGAPRENHVRLDHRR